MNTIQSTGAVLITNWALSTNNFAFYGEREVSNCLGNDADFQLLIIHLIHIKFVFFVKIFHTLVLVD